MRAAAKGDFTVSVPGVGDFVFGRRNLGDHMKVNVEYARLTEGVFPTPWLDTMATSIATIKVLAVRVPEGFDVDALDPLDDKTETDLMNVLRAVREKEDSFRPGAKAADQGSGEAPVDQRGVLVPTTVQPHGD